MIPLENILVESRWGRQGPVASGAPSQSPINTHASRVESPSAARDTGADWRLLPQGVTWGKSRGRRRTRHTERAGGHGQCRGIRARQTHRPTQQDGAKV